MAKPTRLVRPRLSEVVLHQPLSAANFCCFSGGALGGRGGGGGGVLSVLLSPPPATEQSPEAAASAPWGRLHQPPPASRRRCCVCVHTRVCTLASETSGSLVEDVGRARREEGTVAARLLLRLDLGSARLRPHRALAVPPQTPAWLSGHPPAAPCSPPLLRGALCPPRRTSDPSLVVVLTPPVSASPGGRLPPALEPSAHALPDHVPPTRSRGRCPVPPLAGRGRPTDRVTGRVGRMRLELVLKTQNKQKPSPSPKPV